MTVTHETKTDTTSEHPAKRTKGGKRTAKAATKEEVAQVGNAPADAAPASEASAPSKASIPSKAKSASSKRLEPELTLQDLNRRYIEHLAASGKSHGTCFSYGMEMNTACRVLGGDTKLGALTPKAVHGYFNAGPVILLKNGKPKAKPSVDKTRRVLRLALVWAADRGWIEKAPLPGPEAN